MSEVEELANKYFDEECPHSYADNEEQLREDVVSAYIKGYEKKSSALEKENKELRVLISSLVYEINQIWDISEMNDDLRRCAEKIDREVQLSKMAEDNRMIISALGFAIVPPKPTLNVKEV